MKAIASRSKRHPELVSGSFAEVLLEDIGSLNDVRSYETLAFVRKISPVGRNDIPTQGFESPDAFG